ncbi:MAG: 5-histidylcysteine sulfoxide synthase [Pseudomonadota bacterium]
MTLTHLKPSPRLDGHDPEATRQAILEYFTTTFDLYEHLFILLEGDDAWQVKPISLRHPLIFYFGHTATFFVNKLVLAGLLAERIDPRMESMFAVGVDEMSWDDLNEQHYDWPSADSVRQYRARVREAVTDLIQTLPLTLPITWEHDWWPILMGIEHERIHLETSSVLIRQHPLHRVKPHPDWQSCALAGEPPENTLVEVPGGRVSIGKPYDAPYYGWDNEYGRHEADLDDFKASRQLVSQREYLRFVEAGGYTDTQWWDEEGQGWLDFTGSRHPTFWHRSESGWQLRVLAELIPMPWNWPVEVNCHEARAYCRWLSVTTSQPVRLPTEDEWYRMHDFAGLSPDSPPAHGSANLNLAMAASSCPVDLHSHGPFHDLVGNVWQWTETAIYPFDGFRVHPLYDDFTTPTYDGRHNLFKGGSWISTGNEAQPASRYAFRRHFFQHAGFRYVVTPRPAATPNTYYETDRQLSEYAEFHYGERYFGVENYPVALVNLIRSRLQDHPGPKHSALDLGCATGRASFELARDYAKVTGVDFSARFISLATEMAEQGRIRYTLTDEGELLSYRERSLDMLGIDADIRARVGFYQGDACNLKALWTDLDLVLAANLIDRLYDPARFLELIAQRIRPGGILVISSPYTWLEEHTPKEAWLGGFKRDGESLTTLQALQEHLAPHFRMLGQPEDVPFVIRETRRKFQHTLAEVSFWERLHD